MLEPTFPRRCFLKALTTVSAGLLLRGAEPNRKAWVGAQLYGWGQYYQREGKNVNDHLDEVFSALRDAGYDYADGTMDTGIPENSARFAERLKSKGLQPVSLYTGGRLHEKDAAEKSVEKIVAAAKVCAQAGFKVISCNPDPIGRAKTDAELKAQADALNQIGNELQKLGLRFGVHNHTPEMQNGAKEFYSNFEKTSTSVGFCYDVHWVFRGGIKPQDILPKYGSRVVCWHLRQSRNGIWWEDLDDGDVDYRWIAEYIRQHNLPEVLTVELAIENGTKITRSVVENHRRSREYVKKVFNA